jgi:hypothetical protein
MLIDNRKLSAFRTTELMIRYKYHSQTTDHTFDTVSIPSIRIINTNIQPLGLNITTSLLRLASSLNISKPLGKSPHDYFLSRHEIGHPRHIVSLFGGDVLPSVLLDKQRIGPRLIIANTGTLRFDLVSFYTPLMGTKADE